MGLFDKMKAANMSLGDVESPDFPCCKIITKNNVPTIVAAAINMKVEDYPIYNENVVEFWIAGVGSTRTKYFILFKDGKRAVITQTIKTEKERKEQRGIRKFLAMAPIERFIYIKMPKTNATCSEEPIQSTQANKTVIEQEMTTQSVTKFDPVEQATSPQEIDNQKTEESKTTIAGDKKHEEKASIAKTKPTKKRINGIVVFVCDYYVRDENDKLVSIKSGDEAIIVKKNDDGSYAVKYKGVVLPSVPNMVLE